MENLMQRIGDLASGWGVVWIVAVLVVLALVLNQWLLRLLGVVLVSDSQIGIVSKKFVLFGTRRTLPDGKIIALDGEAGYQADTLAPGLHWGYWPWQYKIEKQAFFTVPPGKVGIIESKDGASIPVGRILGQHVDCDSFQSARAFLAGGGQRGPQMDVVPPGTYRINTALFKTQLVGALSIPKDKVGIITTFEGVPLPSGEIAGKEVEGHNLFQDAHAFVQAGGYKGLQVQVMMAGTYYTNPLFMSVEEVELTNVPIGYVGVVVSYVGEPGLDISGVAFTHGNIVSRGQKGVWGAPLDPGRYPVNTRTQKVEPVPTTNIVLNWATGKSEAHKLDEKLSTIEVRSADGFAFNLDVAQIVHVSRENAPLVIARFGSMVNLVSQVLEPTIGNYFRNSAQRSDVIAFLREREQRQLEAGDHIRAALEKYNVQAVDTLIGDINPPEALMTTLTDRKVAEQRKMTLEVQEAAEVQRQQFEKAKSEADTRGRVVSASRDAEVAKLEADSAVNKAQGEASSKKIIAEGEAAFTQVTGQAIAAKTKAVGEAEAGVLQLKVASVGGANYALMNIFDALAASKSQLVPQVVVTGGERGAGGTIIEAFLATLLAQQAGGTQPPAAGARGEPGYAAPIQQAWPAYVGDMPSMASRNGDAARPASRRKA